MNLKNELQKHHRGLARGLKGELCPTHTLLLVCFTHVLTKNSSFLNFKFSESDLLDSIPLPTNFCYCKRRIYSHSK